MDEANFETLTRAELVKMNLDGAGTPYKSADIYAGIQLSPDGNYVMISTIKKPFSYIVPLSRFPMTAQVFDLQGNLVKTVNDVPIE